MASFGLQTPEDLFREIDSALTAFKTPKGTNNQTLFFLLAALNHLREWIAPGYKPNTDKNGNLRNTPKTAGEKFYVLIYENPEWRLINELCNGYKHCLPSESVQDDNASSLMADMHSLTGVNSLSHGHSQCYEVNGRGVVEVMETVRDFYQKEWFEKQNP